MAVGVPSVWVSGPQTAHYTVAQLIIRLGHVWAVSRIGLAAQDLNAQDGGAGRRSQTRLESPKAEAPHKIVGGDDAIWAPALRSSRSYRVLKGHAAAPAASPSPNPSARYVSLAFSIFDLWSTSVRVPWRLQPVFRLGGGRHAVGRR